MRHLVHRAAYLSCLLWAFSASSQNMALRFDGVSDAAVSAATKEAVTFNRYTIETWVSLDDAQGDSTDALVCVGGHAEPLLWLWYDRAGVQFPANSLVFGFFDGTNNQDFAHAFDFPAAVWTHIAVSYNGASASKTLSLYINGVLVKTVHPTASPANWSNERILLGKIPGSTLPGQHLAGALDDVRVWKTNRSTSLIANNRNKELTGTEANLWGYYKINGGPCGTRDCAGEDIFLVPEGSPVMVSGPMLTPDATCPSPTCEGPMTGVFTIGGSSPDFADISAAMTALHERGASSTVVFHVRPGLYTESLQTQPFQSFNRDTRAIFKRDPGLTGAARIRGTTYALRVSNTDNCQFENLTFESDPSGTALVLVDSCLRARFLGCTFDTPAGKTGLTRQAGADSLSVENCQFMNGSNGIFLEGTGKWVRVSGNHFYEQTANGLNQNGALEDVVISGNMVVSAGNANFYAFRLNNLQRAFKVLNNRIDLGEGSGIYMGYSNQHTSRSLVANNVIHIPTDARYGIRVESGNRTDFLHNTVLIKSPLGGSAFYFNYRDTKTHIVKNNIFANTGAGYASTIQSSGLLECNHNILFSGSPAFASNTLTEFRTLATWQNAVGYDLSSKVQHPYPVSGQDPTPLNPLVCNVGTPVQGIPEVQTDFFGNTRNNPPDPGVAEFEVSAPSPMCGTYTVGGATPDFLHPALAAVWLQYNGANCPVTFDIRPALYTEPFEIQGVAKGHPDDPIVFRHDHAAPPNAEVTIQGSVRVSDVPIVRFEGLKFHNPTSSTALILRSAKCRVRNCAFTGKASWVGIEADVACDSLTVDSCQFLGGGRGVWLRSAATGNTLTGVSVRDAYFEGQSFMALRGEGALPGFIFRGNTVFATGVSLSDAGVSDVVLLSNRFINPLGMGLEITNLAPATGHRALVANNFFSTKSEAGAPGINFSNCQKIDFLHNSLTTVPSSTGICMALTGTSYRLKNNILASKHGRPVLSATAGSLLESDHNDLFSTGSLLAVFGSTNCASLAAWKTAAGTDVHSVSADPLFYSLANLTPFSAAVDGIGISITGLPGLSTDITGATRTDPPDLGAIQFLPGTIGPLCGTYKVGGFNCDFAGPVDVASMLNTHGVGCDVAFDFAPVNFGEPLVINNVAKLDAANSIAFRGAQSQTSLSQLTQLVVQNTSKVAAENLKLGNSSVQNSAQARFWNCDFEAANGSLLLSVGDNDSLRIDSCRFKKGSNQIFVKDGTPTNLPEGITIEKCVFEQGSAAIAATGRFKGLSVKRNTSLPTTERALHIYSAAGSFSAHNNRFFTSSPGHSLYMDGFQGDSADRAVFGNNFAVRLNVKDATHLDIFHNNLSCLGANTAAACILTGGGHNRLFNNILFHFGGGKAIEMGAANSLDGMDNNNLFSDGPVLAKVGNTNCPDLEAWQSATGLDSNAVSVHPFYVSSTNLTPQNSSLNSVGVPVAGNPLFLHDIDGNPRSLPPDIGAKEFEAIGAPMCGNYTVGGDLADFANVAEAIAQLSYRGISCDVVLNVRSGTYPQAVDLVFIEGSDQHKLKVRWDSMPGQAKPVISGGFKLRQVPGVRFERLWFENTVSSRNPFSLQDAPSTTFSGCVFRGIGAGFSVSGLFLAGNCDSLLVDSCRVLAGEDGITFSSPTTSARGGTVQHSAFSGQLQFCLRLKGQLEGFRFRRNNLTFLSSAPDGAAIATGESYGNVYIAANRIQTALGTGIAINGHAGTSTARLVVANNFIRGDGTTIHAQAGGFVDVFQNTLGSASKVGQTNCAPLRIGMVSNIRMKNNIMQSTGSGIAYWQETASAVVESDYNDFFTAGRLLIRLDQHSPSYLTNLSIFQAAGRDVHSLSVNPIITVLNDPTPNNPALDGAGAALGNNFAYLTDVSGNMHGSPPDIGAKEFSPVDEWLCGTYTVGGASPAYTSPASAVAAMQSKGVDCDVTFLVRPGTYVGQVLLEQIPKTQNDLGITFKPDPAFSDTVVLSDENFPVKISGTSNVWIVGMGLTGSQNGYYPSLAALYDARKITFDRCTFLPPSTEIALTSSASSDSLVVKNCRFTASNYAIHTGASNSVNIENCYFSDVYRAVLSTAKNLVIKKNTVVSNHTSPDSWGFFLDGYQATIVGNTIQKTSGNGIYLGYEHADTNTLVANNLISLGTGAEHGIWLAGHSYSGGDGPGAKVFHNTVYVGSNPNSTQEKALEVQTKAQIRNNIFACLNPHPAAYFPNFSSLSDYNDFYSQGPVLLKRATVNYTTLADWQAASGRDAHSKSVDPQFTSVTELLPTNSLLDGAGNFISGIPPVLTDFRDSLRSDPPDMGAIEFGNSYFPHDLGVTALLAPMAGCAPLGSQSVQVRIRNFSNIPQANFTVKFAVNGGGVVSAPFSGPALQPGDSAVFTFPQQYVFTAPGDFGFAAWTQRTGDVQPSNDTSFAVIHHFAPPSVAVAISLPASCPSAGNGSLTLSTTGGAAPFVYDLGLGQQPDSVFSGLAPGAYTATVTDGNGCTDTVVGTVGSGDGDGLDITVGVSLPASCPSAGNGSLAFSTTGGQAPFVYDLGLGQQPDSLFSSLAPGAYTATVTDDNGCTDTVIGTVGAGDGDGLDITVGMSLPASCLGMDNGSLVFSTIGGTVPFLYDLGLGQQPDSLFSGLTPGAYTATVTDGNGCTDTVIGTVEAGSGPDVNVAGSTPVSCPGTDNGSLAISASGMEPFTYDIGFGSQPDSVFSNLPAGTYTATVTDAEGCTATTIGVIDIGDLHPPVFTYCPPNLTAQLVCDHSTVRVLWNTPMATDDCGLQGLTSDASSGDWFPFGETTVTITATDVAGNTSLCSFQVNVLPPGTIRTWLGGTGNWSTPAKWSGGVVPTLCDTVIVNSGTITMTSNPTYVKALFFNGGKIQGNDSLVILEKMWWTGGTVAVPLVLEGFDNLWDGGTLNLKRSLRNVGDIHFVGGKLVFGGNVRLLNEGGIWVDGATSAFVNSQANNMFENRGALLIGAAVAAFTTNVPFENSEDIYLASTVTLRVNNTFQHSGWISFGGNSKVRMTAQTTVFSFTTHPLAVGSTCQFVVEGSGSFIVDGGLGQNCHFEVTAGRWQVNAPVSVGTVNFSNGRIEGSGSLTTRKLEWSGGRLQVPTTLDWLGGDFNGGSGYLEALLTNNSNFNLYSGNLLLAAQGKIVNNGVFNHIGADASVNRSGAQVAQVVENHNLYRKTGAVTGAAAKFGVPVVNTPTGEMHGIGTVRFLSGLAQNGTFSPGLDSAAGTFRVEPTWTNNANLSFTIVRHGSDTATTHDKMEVQGQTLLSGSLVVTEVGTVPDGSFDIISCGTPTGPNCLSGTFSSLDLPAGYTVQYTGKKVRLVKNTMLANRSGVLDRADGPASAAEGTATVHVSPNPFEAQAQVSLVLQKEMLVRVAVFDATGREVCVLQERARLAAGRHAFDWRPEGDAHGAFWVRVEGEGFDQTRRIVRMER